MSRLLTKPKRVVVTVVLAVLFVLGILGGALGNDFGGGFLGSPMAHIQLPAENITATPNIGSFHITNTMVATWAAILVLAVVSFLATRRIQEVPGRLQSLVEAILEVFLSLGESVAGPEKARRFFPLVMTIFLFVVVANWMGVLPGYGTVGRFEPAEEVIHHADHKAHERGENVDLSKVNLQVFERFNSVAILPFGSVDSVTTAQALEDHGHSENAGLLVPFLRSANTDLNTTLAIAIIAMVMVHWWGFSALGVVQHAGKFINIKGGPIGIFVGILELVSEIARVLSFTFRLFGNIFAGEVLLIAMAFLIPLVGLVPFMGLELFVGLIQAFIFSMLTLVFAATATIGHGDNDH